MKLVAKRFLAVLCFVVAGTALSSSGLATTVGVDDANCVFQKVDDYNSPDYNETLVNSAKEWCNIGGGGNLQYGSQYIIGYFKNKNTGAPCKHKYVDQYGNPEYGYPEYLSDNIHCLCSSTIYPFQSNGGALKPEFPIFVGGVGCACPAGKYGLAFGIAYPEYYPPDCQSCPDGGDGWLRTAQSNPGSNTNIRDCFSTTDFNGTCNGSEPNIEDGWQMCDWNTSTNSYSDCTITSLEICCPGYYQREEGEMYCSPVGLGHYGPVNLGPYNSVERRQCPNYLSNSVSDIWTVGSTGGETQGETIADCFVPMNTALTDETGMYVYAQNCHYTP